MIKFTNIKWKNFLSTGAQFTEVKLNKISTTLIVAISHSEVSISLS